MQVKGGVSEGDFKFKLVTVGDSGVRQDLRGFGFRAYGLNLGF